MNAVITVAYNGHTVEIPLEGNELSHASDGKPYLGNASRGFIADEVEKALINLTGEQA